MNGIISKNNIYLTKLVRNVSISAYEKKYDEVLRNIRLAAETILKSVIYYHNYLSRGIINNFNDFLISLDGQELSVRVGNDGKITIKYPGQSARPLMLNDSIKIVDKLNLFDNNETFNAFKFIRIKGNEASHSNDVIFSDNDITTARESLEIILKWYFQFNLKENIPAQIIKALQINSLDLKYFDPIDSLLNVSHYNYLFSNDLIYFTSDEIESIDNIVQNLFQNKIFMIKGKAASGKSVLTSSLAAKFAEKGLKTYYYSYKRKITGDLWDDIHKCLHKNIVFIIDDCHLNADEASKIVYKFNGIKADSSAALIFVSRTVEHKTKEIENENLLNKLESYELESSASQFFEKSKGIIDKYKDFYEKINNRNKYEIGEIEKVVDNCYKNLFTLHTFLNKWKDGPFTLSDIDKNDIYKSTYAKYYNNYTLNIIDCLQKYSCLYSYEIEFEAAPDKINETRRIFEDGIIEESGNKFVFMHSDYAKLFVESYISHNEFFERQYENKDNYIFELIKGYILDFKSVYYPSNLIQIFKNLTLNSELEIIKKLFSDNEVANIVINYIVRNSKATIDNIIFISCLTRLVKTDKSVFEDIFKKIAIENKKFNKLLMQADYSLEYYNALLHLLQIYESDLTTEFEKIFSFEDEKKMFIKTFVEADIYDNGYGDLHLGSEGELIEDIFDIKGYEWNMRYDFKFGRKTHETFKRFDIDEFSKILSEKCPIYDLEDIIDKLKEVNEEITKKINFKYYIEKLSYSNEKEFINYISNLSKLSILGSFNKEKFIDSYIDYDYLSKIFINASIDTKKTILNNVSFLSLDMYLNLSKLINYDEIKTVYKKYDLDEILDEINNWKRIGKIHIKKSDSVFEVNSEVYENYNKHIKIEDYIDLKHKYDISILDKIKSSLGKDKAIEISKTIKIKALKISDGSLGNFLNSISSLFEINEKLSLKLFNSIKPSSILDFINKSHISDYTKYIEIIKKYSEPLTEYIIKNLDYKSAAEKFKNLKIVEYKDDSYLISRNKDDVFSFINSLNNFNITFCDKLFNELNFQDITVYFNGDFNISALSVIHKFKPEIANEILKKYSFYSLANAYISNDLPIITLNKIDSALASKIVNFSHDKILEKLKKLQFDNICSKLSGFKNYNIEYSNKLLNDLGLEFLNSKSKNEDIDSLIEGLNHLYEIEPLWAKTILNKNIDFIQSMFDNTSAYLILTNYIAIIEKIDHESARKIYLRYDVEKLIELLKNNDSQNSYLSELYRLFKIDHAKTKLILQQIDLEHVSCCLWGQSLHYNAFEFHLLKEMDYNLANKLFEIRGSNEILELAQEEEKEKFADVKSLTLDLLCELMPININPDL